MTGSKQNTEFWMMRGGRKHEKDQLFLSTIAPDAAEEARRHGLGLEIAEYCTAWNMDEQFERPTLL